MQMKRYVKLQAESLEIEEDMAKVIARAKIYEEENIWRRHEKDSNNDRHKVKW